MEAVNTSITELNQMFHERMLQFEQELKKAPVSTTTAGLAADFTLFRNNIVQALTTIQQQVDIIARSLDNMEMRSRRKILLLHGVSETKEEKTSEVVTRLIRERFKIQIVDSDIKRCHRLGRSTSPQKPRPILFKLYDAKLRSEVWFSKTKLKGSGVTVSEFLTNSRHKLFMAAREKFGVSQCWTSEGTVFVLDTAGKRHRLSSPADLSRLEQRLERTTDQAQQSATAKVAPASKLKRAAAKK